MSLPYSAVSWSALSDCDRLYITIMNELSGNERTEQTT